MEKRYEGDYLRAQLEAAARLLGCKAETLMRCCIAEALPNYLTAADMAEVVSLHPCPDDGGAFAPESAHEREFCALCDERDVTRGMGMEVADFPAADGVR